MKHLFILVLTLMAVGCLHRAESENLLEARADYLGKEKAEASALKLSSAEIKRNAVTGAPVRTPPKVAHIWIYPHETPNKEYFWGGWISVVVEGDHWQTPNQKDPEFGSVLKEVSHGHN
jgi:hypothetical protein